MVDGCVGSCQDKISIASVDRSSSCELYDCCELRELASCSSSPSVVSFGSLRQAALYKNDEFLECWRSSRATDSTRVPQQQS